MKKNISYLVMLFINIILYILICNLFPNLNNLIVGISLFSILNILDWLKEKKNFYKNRTYISIYLILTVLLNFYLKFSMYTVIVIAYTLIILLTNLLKDNKKFYDTIFLICTFFLMSLFITSNTNSSPQGNNMTYTDSSVSKYIGKMMTQGKVPYLDGFDHKGLFLFIINFIGYLINEHWGIWLLENVALVITMFFGFKFVNLYTKNNIVSYFSVLCCMLTIASIYNGGNYTDEWEIPLVMISLYYFFKGIKNNNLKNVYCVIIGICCSLGLLLRPNIVLIWVVFAVYLLIKYILDKKFKELFSKILWFAVGNLIVLVPSILYLIINNAFEDFIYQCFIFNFNYFSNWPSPYTYKQTFEYFYGLVPIILPCLAINIIALINSKKDKILPVINLVLFFVSLYLIISPKNLYEHYAMIILPILLYPISWIINLISKNISNNKFKTVIALVILVICIQYKEINVIYNKAISVKNDGEWLVEIKTAIQENSKKDDNVLVIGNDCLLYLISDRMYHNKFFYSGITIIDEKLENDFIDEVKNDNPDVIVTSKSIVIEEINEIINSNYTYVGTYNPNYELYVLNGK